MPIAKEEDVLALSAEMTAFVDAHVDQGATESFKLHQLISAIIDTNTFGVVYDQTTRTAAETYRVRKGNCLSFSNLFVAMARAAGLRVQFQEVDVPPDWTFDRETYVLNGHVNVHVDLGPAGKRVVDFNIADFKTSYEMEKVSDARGFAHYYNNIGVERMQIGDSVSAFWCFHRAIANNDRQFSPAWTNLGTLYLRAGQTAYAEAAYFEALKVTGSDLVALSNLARLYERAGKRDLAAEYQGKVIYHRSRNPYYRYELGRRAYFAKQYNAAIGHIKYAIRKRPKEDQFYFMLGLCYLQRGDKRTAQEWLDRAVQVAASDPLKRKYSSKIDTLFRRGT